MFLYGFVRCNFACPVDDDICNEIPLLEHLVEQALYVCLILVVYAAKDNSVVREQLACQHQSWIEHREQVVSGDGVVVICFCKLTHTVLAIWRVDVYHIDSAFVLDEQIQQGGIIVSDNELVGYRLWVRDKGEGLVLLEIGDRIALFFETFVEKREERLKRSEEFTDNFSSLMEDDGK